MFPAVRLGKPWVCWLVSGTLQLGLQGQAGPSWGPCPSELQKGEWWAERSEGLPHPILHSEPGGEECGSFRKLLL